MATPKRLAHLLPVFAAFLFSKGVHALAALDAGLDPANGSTWSRWDSGHYLSIAQRGYELVSCKRIGYPSPDDWCGNGAWFAGYPGLIHLLTRFGLDAEAAGIWISSVFLFLILHALWNRFLKREFSAFPLLLLAGVFPGSIYFHAVFPMSMEVFFVLATLLFYDAGKPFKASLCAFLAAFTYPVGILAPVFIAAEGARSRLWKPKAFIGISGVLGFLAVLAIQRVQTGVWGVYFLASSKYQVWDTIPFSRFAANAAKLLSLREAGPRVWIVLQTDLLSLLMLALIASFAKKRAYRDADHAKRMSLAFVYWLVPQALGGQLSFYRSEALALPLVLLLPLLPGGVVALLVPAFTLIAFGMARLFFLNVLI